MASEGAGLGGADHGCGTAPSFVECGAIAALAAGPRESVVDCVRNVSCEESQEQRSCAAPMASLLMARDDPVRQVPFGLGVTQRRASVGPA
jgi:hypothetical protein